MEGVYEYMTTVTVLNIDITFTVEGAMCSSVLDIELLYLSIFHVLKT